MKEENELKINSSRFGEIVFSSGNVIHFPEGVYGFPEENRMIILNSGQKDFFWLHSVVNPQTAFLVTDPRFFMPSYEEILSGELLFFSLCRDKYSIFCPAWYEKDRRKVCCNTAAPFLIDNKNRNGFQFLLNSDKVSTRCDVVESLMNFQKQQCCMAGR